MRFTQYNAIPTSLNPAYAGASEHSRLVTAYRNQWSALPQAYTGWHVAHDWYQRDIRSGFGILISNELAGSGALRNARAAFQYAYEIPLGGGRRIRPALQAAVGNRSIDMSRLTFSDQLVRGGAATSIEAACATPACAALRPVLRKPARRAAACVSPARACARVARNSSLSNRTSRSPDLTIAPAATATCSTRPVSVLPTSTRDKVATRAENCKLRTKGAMRALAAGTRGARVTHQAARAAKRSATAAATSVITRRRHIASIVAPRRLSVRA
jgi:hypothetical protein